MSDLLETLTSCVNFALDQGCDQILIRPETHLDLAGADAIAIESQRRLSSEAASIVYIPFLWSDKVEFAIFEHLKKILPKKWDVRRTDLNGVPRLRAFGPQQHRDFTRRSPQTFGESQPASFESSNQNNCATCPTSGGCSKKR